MLIINGKLSLYYQIIPLNTFNYESIKTEYQCKLSVFWGLTIRSTRFFSAAQFLIRISGDSVQTLEGVFQPPCHHIQSSATPELNGILCIFQEISREHYTFLAQKVKSFSSYRSTLFGPDGHWGKRGWTKTWREGWFGAIGGLLLLQNWPGRARLLQKCPLSSR